MELDFTFNTSNLTEAQESYILYGLIILSIFAIYLIKKRVKK